METLVAFGSEIKAVEETEDSYKFGAFLVVFDSPDISQFRDSFTKSTDFGFEDGETRPLLYNHGLDGTFGKTTIGKAKLFMRDAGVWMEGEIKKRRDYLEKHVERVGEGLRKTIEHRGVTAPVFGTSSGATGHAVVREAKGEGHEIKQWFIGEASITPTPAEPQTACLSLKSLHELEVAEGIAEVEELEAKYSHNQPRDDEGKWTIIAGSAHRISGKKVSKADVIALAHEHGVSKAGVAALSKAHDEGKITTDDHLLRAIAHGIHHADGDSNNAAHVEEGIRKHGRGGSHENQFGGWEGKKPTGEAMRDASELPASARRPATLDAVTQIQQNFPGSAFERQRSGIDDRPMTPKEARSELQAAKEAFKEADQKYKAHREVQRSASLQGRSGNSPANAQAIANESSRTYNARNAARARLDAARMRVDRMTGSRKALESLEEDALEIKAGRTLSGDSHARLRDLYDELEAADEQHHEAMDALQDFLLEQVDDEEDSPVKTAPEEEKTSGAYDPLEIGRYVQSQLALSGVNYANGA